MTETVIGYMRADLEDLRAGPRGTWRVLRRDGSVARHFPFVAPPTDADQLLRLARAVFPEAAAVVEDAGAGGYRILQ